MGIDYPDRPMAAPWLRYACMALGGANVVAGVVYGAVWQRDLFMTGAALMGGGAWFAFGKYGGFPLVDTVADWHPPGTPGEINDMHRRGLLVMRRRRWMMYAAVPSGFAVAALLIPPLLRAGHPELTALVVGVPWLVINLRYLLSRCPRCGYGFFARSASRAALLRSGKTCAQCGLSLYAYKEPIG